MELSAEQKKNQDLSSANTTLRETVRNLKEIVKTRDATIREIKKEARKTGIFSKIFGSKKK